VYQVQQTQNKHKQLQNGLSWTFDHPSDLVGGHGTGFNQLSFEHGHLVSGIAQDIGFISLNFEGSKIDALLFDRLSLRIWVSAATELSFYFRETLDGNIFTTDRFALKRGWNTIDAQLTNLGWQQAQFDPQGKIIGTWETASWGGKTNQISVIRIHPINSKAQFRLETVSLLPTLNPNTDKNIIIETPIVPIAQLNITKSNRSPLVLLNSTWNTPESVLRFRDQLTQFRPSATLRINRPVSGGNAPHFPLISSTLAIAGLLLIVLGLILKQNAAFPTLSGIVMLALSLLTENRFDLTSGLKLALLVISLLIVFKYHQTRRINWFGLPYPDRSKMLTGGTILLIGLIYLAFTQPNSLLGLPMYLPWALTQQFLLCGVFYGLLKHQNQANSNQYILPAFLFALVHYPNFNLMLLTLLFGMICIVMYRRGVGIVTLAVIHAACGTLVLNLTSDQILRSGEVGLRFFH